MGSHAQELVPRLQARRGGGRVGERAHDWESKRVSRDARIALGAKLTEQFPRRRLGGEEKPGELSSEAKTRSCVFSK